MEISVYENKDQLSKVAARKAAEMLKNTIHEEENAVFVAATGASQFDFLKYLTKKNSIDWSETTMFHLDEYVGLPSTHPASFRNYLKKRLIDKVEPGTVHLINGEREDPQKECDRLNKIIQEVDIDIAFIGIGENGHIAFNDPPADFNTEEPFIVVELDKKCREQQVGEGWFDSIEEVPQKAITMSVKQIMKADKIVCTVPGARKAEAVQKCFKGKISPYCPASILQRHDNAYIYLDKESASLMD